MKEWHIGIVTRNVVKASGKTSKEQTAKVSSKELSGAVYFKAETLYDGEYPIPAIPSFGYVSSNSSGDFYVPAVGDTLRILIDVSLDLPSPTYTACLYTLDNIIHRDFRKNYPERSGRVTRGGHKFIFDDSVGEKLIKLEHDYGQFVQFDNDGSFTIHSRDVTSRHEHDEDKDEYSSEWFRLRYDRILGTLSYKYQYSDSEYAELLIDKSGKMTKLHDHHGNKIEMDASNVKVTDKSGNVITMNSSSVSVESVGNTIVNASGDCEVNATNIKLNGSSSGVTTKNSHQGVIDLITGVPVSASSTVMADI